MYMFKAPTTALIYVVHSPMVKGRQSSFEVELIIIFASLPKGTACIYLVTNYSSHFETTTTYQPIIGYHQFGLIVWQGSFPVPDHHMDCFPLLFKRRSICKLVSPSCLCILWVDKYLVEQNRLCLKKK